MNRKIRRNYEDYFLKRDVGKEPCADSDLSRSDTNELAGIPLGGGTSEPPQPTPSAVLDHQSHLDMAFRQQALGDPSPANSSTYDHILIAVMGDTGSGKSSLVRLLSGADIKVGDELESCTSKVEVTPAFEFEGRNIVLIDTPGFNDTNLTERDVLTEISIWLANMYEHKVLLTGILFLHRISDNRFGGMMVRNFAMFQELCGMETMENVVIATTMWDKVTEAEGWRHEEQLIKNPKFFQKAIVRGASLLRHDRTLESARALLQKLMRNKPKPLQIQCEIVDEKKTLQQTAAGSELDPAHRERIEKLRKEIGELTECLRKVDQVDKAEFEKERADLKRTVKILEHNQKHLTEGFEAEIRTLRKELEQHKRLLQASRKRENEFDHQADLIQIWSKISQNHKEYQQSQRGATNFTTYQSLDTEYRDKEKLLIAFDLGTTSSAVSFVHLYPGENPCVRMVNRWSGQKLEKAKIATLVSYQNQKAVAYGENAVEHLGDTAYSVAKWFKLFLHPPNMQNSSAGNALSYPKLPEGVSIERVYADFIGFLYKETGEFFKSNIDGGDKTWEILQSSVELIFAIPNGWSPIQQGFLRDVAIDAGILPNTNADDRIKFISEAEASVHFAMVHGDTEGWMVPGAIFALLDAGGSTVDTTLYRCKTKSPRLTLEEVRASECVQAGGVCVDDAAANLLRERLRGSDFVNDDNLALMVKVFESKTKRLFNGKDNNVIPFGPDNLDDPQYGIMQGRIKLSAADLELTFDPSIKDILESCRRLFSREIVKNLIIVGGFGQSPYLVQRVREGLSEYDTQVTDMRELQNLGNKAAVEGAAIWGITQMVKGRAIRFTHGLWVSTVYDPSSSVHAERSRKRYVDLDGCTRIDNIFDPMVKKNTIVEDASPISVPYCRLWDARPTSLKSFGTGIYIWEGPGLTNWCTNTGGVILSDIRNICTIQADLSNINLSAGTGPEGPYWRIDYNVVIFFEGVKMKARLEWIEEGNKRQGPAKVVEASLY